MRPEYCWDCGHALDVHIPEQFTRKAYCAMWGCSCFCYGIKFSPGQPAGDAGTGRVPPTRLADSRPGEITNERRNAK